MAKKTTKKSKTDPERRKSSRRADTDRRVANVAVAAERRTGERRKVVRRRQIDPTTCERDYSNDEIEFMHAMDDYKRDSGRMFPTCSEILEVVRKLGYEKCLSREASPVSEFHDTTGGIELTDPSNSTENPISANA